VRLHICAPFGPPILPDMGGLRFGLLAGYIRSALLSLSKGRVVNERARSRGIRHQRTSLMRQVGVGPDAPELYDTSNTRVINVGKFQVPFICERYFVDSNRIGR
jgi:hypothetical protein